MPLLCFSLGLLCSMNAFEIGQIVLCLRCRVMLRVYGLHRLPNYYVLNSIPINLKYMCIVIVCVFANCMFFLQILDPRTATTFPDHSPLTKAARLSSTKTSTAIL